MNFFGVKKIVTRRLNFENCGAGDETKSSFKNDSEERKNESDNFEFAAGEMEENAIPATESSSPILFWKCPGQKKPTTKAPTPADATAKRAAMKSPIFRTRKKKKKRRKEEKAVSSTCIGAAFGDPNPGSPILTCESVLRKKRSKTVQMAIQGPDKREGVEEAPSGDAVPSKATKSMVFGGDSTFENLNERHARMKYPEIPLFRGSRRDVADSEENGKSAAPEDTGDSYEIEDFSQESPKEIFDSVTRAVKVANRSSNSKTYPDADVSEGESREISISFASEFEICKSSSINESHAESTLEFLDSGRKRKRFKKGSLVERLDNLKKRLASERRIREHKKKVMKARQNWKKTLFVLELWKDVTRLMLKCQEVEVREGSTTAVAFGQSLYLILDKENGIDFKNIREGTVLRIAPPWQEMQLQKFGASILLSLTSLELIDKIHGTKPKTGLREASIAKYMENEESLFDVLLNSEADVFLHK